MEYSGSSEDLLFFGVSLVMLLGLLYGLVRFVKWAWTD
jgi:hypothetical protein